MEHLADFNADNVKDNMKESLDFITDVDKNTAKILEDTKKMRLDIWMKKNIFERVDSPEAREELEKGFNAASEEIIKQSLNDNQEGK
jgi:hypothetical protein